MLAKPKQSNGAFYTPKPRLPEVFRAGAEIGDAKMERGMTIAKVPEWMEIKPEMMRHLMREHEKLGRTLTEEETVTLLRSVVFEIIQGK